MRVLAIDFGTKRIGLSVTDSSMFLASPLPAIINYRDYDDALKQISKIIERYFDIKRIVIGVTEVSEREATKPVNEFIKLLQQKISLELIKVNEDFTTKKAISKFKEVGLKSSQIKNIVDSAAAVNILEDYLESIRQK